jgi:hypothetical protein
MSLSAEDKKKLSRFLASPIMNDQSQIIRGGFKNYMNTQTVADAIVVNIETKMALHTFMCEIQALNKNKNPEDRIIVRAAAGGNHEDPHSASYSATTCTSADIVLRLTGSEFHAISRMKDSNIMRVGASVQIGELDKQLYNKHQLALPTSSLIPYVSVGGLAAAGGHGTGKNQPSFAGLVRGMTLCLENGKEVHIDQSHPDFATIAGANNGLFGVVIDMDIECVPAQKMQCVMEKRSPIEFMEAVENGLFENDPYVSVMYVPTYLDDEMTNRTMNNVIIYRWRPAPLDTHNTNHDESLSDFEQAAEMKLSALVNVPEVLRKYPSLIPAYMRHITTPLAIGNRDQLALGPWHEMMHYRTAFPRDLDEICGIFPVQDQPIRAAQGQEIVRALKHAMTLLGDHAKRGEYPVTYGLYFRYLQGTNGGLSFTAHPEGHHVCAMDITSNENIRGFADFKKNMQQFFIDEMHAKFHWGKNAPTDVDYAKLYGAAWENTKTVLERWHKQNHISTVKSALLNPLFSQVLDYPPPSLVDAPDIIPSHTANKHVTAVNAKKLVAIIETANPVSKETKAQIEADLKQETLGKVSFFAGTASKTDVKNTEEKQSSFCVIL